MQLLSQYQYPTQYKVQSIKYRVLCKVQSIRTARSTQVQYEQSTKYVLYLSNCSPVGSSAVISYPSTVRSITRPE